MLAHRPSWDPLSEDTDELREERERFFERASRPTFLAYSGGKDSTAALCHLRHELCLPVVAVLFDNGFIPAEVPTAASSVEGPPPCRPVRVGP